MCNVLKINLSNKSTLRFLRNISTPSKPLRQIILRPLQERVRVTVSLGHSQLRLTLYFVSQEQEQSFIPTMLVISSVHSK